MSHNTLETMIKARYPLILVQSYEEHRVLQGLAGMCPKTTSLFSWSITQGLQSTLSKSGTGPGGAKPAEFLLSLSGSLRGDAVVVLLDFHPYLSDPVVVRALRDVVDSFRTDKAKRTMILCSSSFPKIPQEIEKVATLLDWDLPTQENLQTLAESTKIPSKQGFSLSDVAQAALGLTEIEAENAFAKSAVLSNALDPLLVQEEKKQIIKKSGLLEYLEPSASFSDVGGLDILKVWIRQRRKAYTAKAREFHLPKPSGVLILGPPGTGKSLVAKAFSNDWRFPLLQLDMGKIFQGLVGSSEENMRKVLKTAEAVSPAILFID